MKTLDIVISIPIGNQRRQTKRVVERIAEILEDNLNEIDGNACICSQETVAENLGIGDCVPLITSGKHSVEITL